jgi:phosphomannomutase
MADTGAVFGGEHSAHYYFRDFWNADSGLLAALHVLAALGASDEPLSSMMERYERYKSSGEINSTVDDQVARTAAVLADFGDEITGTTRMDGVTVDLADGSWFNLRASNTEPLLRLNVEAPTKDRVDELVDRILGVVRG